MKISDNNTLPAAPPVRQERAADSPAPAAKSVDTVSSTDAEQIRRAVAEVRDLVGTARSAKMAQLEAAVRSGSYPPNPTKIAEQILGEAVLTAQLAAQLLR